MLNVIKNNEHYVKFQTKLDNCKHYQKFLAYKEKVLAMGNDSLEKTIAIAVALCLVCSVLVSFGAVALKPLQVYNKNLDMKKNILEVAGLMEEDTDIDKAFAEQIEAKIVNLETGEYDESVNAEEYDQRKAAKDPKQSIAIPKDKDIAHIRAKAKLAKVFLVKEGQQYQVDYPAGEWLWFVVNIVWFLVIGCRRTNGAKHQLLRPSGNSRLRW